MNEFMRLGPTVTTGGHDFQGDNSEPWAVLGKREQQEPNAPCRLRSLETRSQGKASQSEGSGTQSSARGRQMLTMSGRGWSHLAHRLAYSGASYTNSF